MNVDQAIRSRRAVRTYKDKEVSRRKIEKIMDAVRNAPSAGNRQDWRFIFVKDEGKKQELFEKAGIQSFVRKAPIIVVGVTTRPGSEMTCGVPAGVVDLSIALDHLTLKAVEEGLGTCWVATFDQDQTKEVLEIPQEYKVVELVTLGYPKDPLKIEKKNRKNVGEIISFDTFTDR